MTKFSSNCYGFMRAGLLNSEEEFYLSRDEAFKGIRGINVLCKRLTKIQSDSSDSIMDCLSEEIENPFSVIEIFDGEKRSQHVAFIDYYGKFYDQDGPDGPIRSGRNIEDLLYEYKELLGTSYYQIHTLNKDLSLKVEDFLNNL